MLIPSRFKWAYLKQRLEYEREVYRQRMAAEVSQVRREADYFIKVSDFSKKKQRLQAKAEKNKNAAGVGSGNNNVKKHEKVFVFKQKETEDVIVDKKLSKQKKNEMFKNKLAAKKQKRKERNQKRREMKAKPEEDFLGSVFVGSAKEN